MTDLHFDFYELFHSDTAEAHGWDNTTSDPRKLTNLLNLTWYCLNPLREYIYAQYKVGLDILNAFRCEKLRAFLKASTTGHPDGECADLHCSKLTNYQLFQFIHNLAKQGKIEYDQLIYEYDTDCCHIGYRKGANRHQTLTRKVVGGKFVYTAVK